MFTSSFRLHRFAIAAIFLCLLLNSSSAITTAQAQGRAYVTNRCNNTVAVIDTNTNTIVRTIPVGLSPVGVAATPDGARVYVTNIGSGTVSVIDAATDTVVTTIPLATGSFNLAVSPDGAHVYIQNLEGTVSVIDTQTNTVVNTIPVGLDPSAVTPDGTRLYGPGGFGIIALDLGTNAVLSTIPITRFNPFGVVFRPDGLFAYVEGHDEHFLIINTALNTVILDTLQINTFHDHMAIAPDGTRLYVTSPSNPGLVVIDTSTNAIVNTIPLGQAAVFPAITSDGRHVYTVNLQNTVSAVDTVTNTATATIPVITMPDEACLLRLAITPAPQSKDDCKNGGYRNFAFPNQGQCIKYVNQHAN